MALRWCRATSIWSVRKTSTRQRPPRLASPLAGPERDLGMRPIDGAQTCGQKTRKLLLGNRLGSGDSD